MTFILPAVRCAKKRRFRSIKKSKRSADGVTRQFHVLPFVSFSRNMKDESSDEDDETIEGAAKEAKERLADRLRFREESDGSSGRVIVSVGKELRSAFARRFSRIRTCLARLRKPRSVRCKVCKPGKAFSASKMRTKWEWLTRFWRQNLIVPARWRCRFY